MTETTALAKKLAALTAEDVAFAADGERIISQAGTPPALAAILQAVDDTVLERTLVVKIGDAQVSLAVAGRRLRGILDVQGDLSAGSNVTGQVLSREEADHLTAVGTMLAAACEGEPVVTVRAEPIQPIGSNSDTGISASILADTWAANIVAAAPKGPMDLFLAENAGNMLSHIHVIKRKVVGSAGKSDVLKDTWKKQVGDFRKRYKALDPKQDVPALVALNDAVGGAQGMALAMHEDEACLFTFEHDQLPAMMQSWSTIAG